MAVDKFRMSAWREILERIFEGFKGLDGYSPEWMINPVTGRRLKLDRYYPELGIAIRFVGLQGAGSYRTSDHELQQEEDRNNMRAWLCRQKGVTLVQLDVDESEPARLVLRLQSALNRAARLLAQSRVGGEMKVDLAPRIVAARRRCDDILRHVRQPDGLKLLADLWQDRQYRTVTDRPASSPSPAAKARRSGSLYRPGMRVYHETFGAGKVMEISGEGGDSVIAVAFDSGDERKFLAKLAAGKLLPAT